MRQLLFIILGTAISTAVIAAPFPKADAAAGGKLFNEAKCNACHAKTFGGDGSSVYTRADRRVKSADALIKQVRACVTQLNVQWFPDEEENVAAYLNQRYYKFP